MLSEWRILYSGAGGGPYNMAVDEVLLNGVITGSSLPTLRFYTWKNDCLSFGFLQRVDEHIRKNCGKFNVEMVRRPTGGYAVLHGWDLCYSIVAPLDGSLAFLPEDASRRVGDALATGLCHLGVPVALSLHEERQDYTVEEISCAAAVSQNELIVKGKKIAGSASLRRKGCYLQHGSIFMEYCEERISELLGNAAGNASLSSRSEGLRQVWDEKFSLMELITALRDGFKRQLNVNMVPAGLGALERAATYELMYKKYTTLDYRKQRGRLSQQHA